MRNTCSRFKSHRPDHPYPVETQGESGDPASFQEEDPGPYDTVSTQETGTSGGKVRFPLRIRHRRAEVIIYGKTKSRPDYRLAFRAGGKRVLRAFQTFSEALLVSRQE